MRFIIRGLTEKQRQLIEQFATERGDRTVHTKAEAPSAAEHSVLDDSGTSSDSSEESKSFLGKLKNLINDKQPDSKKNGKGKK